MQPHIPIYHIYTTVHITGIFPNPVPSESYESYSMKPAFQKCSNELEHES